MTTTASSCKIHLCREQSFEAFDSFIQDPDGGCSQLLHLTSPLSTCQRSAFFVHATATLFDLLNALTATTAARGGLCETLSVLSVCFVCYPPSQLAVMHIFAVNGHRKANEVTIQGPTRNSITTEPGNPSR